MRRTAILAGLVLAALLAWLLRGNGERPGAVTLGTPAAASKVDDGAAPLEPVAVPARRALPPDGDPALETEPELAAAPAAARVGPELPRLCGTLLDHATRAPLPGRRLELLPVFRRSAPGHVVTTDAAGEFELALEAGEYLVLHRAEPGSGERALARELTPSRCEVRREPGGAPQAVTFLARRPPAELEVEVVHADGRPAEGALVVFTCSLEDEPFVDPGGRTDDSGRVRLGVWDPAEFEHGSLRAEDGEGNVAGPLAVEAPLAPGLRRLVLTPGGELAVRVVDAGGRPVPGRRILLASDAALGTRLYRETDADGRRRFDGLLAGAYTLNVQVPEEDRWERRGVELARGERRELEVLLPEPEEPLAVAGRVLDEEDRPLSGVELAVAVDGWPAGQVRTDAAGVFELHAPRGERVWVGANAIEQGDRYEPGEVESAFGEGHLLFRRAARAELRSFEVEVYDATTGAELEHFVATIDRGPGTELWSDSYAPRRRFELRLLPDGRWRVKSHGYLVRELNLCEALDALEPGERLRVGLEPGLDHALQVLDADTLQAIPDVLFRSPTAGEARTDASGRVHLRSDHWPVYRVTREGNEPEDWDPDSEVLWGNGPFLLVRS